MFDCSAAARDLGFRPRTTWAEGAAAFDFDSVPPPDPVEAARCQAIVDAWSDACRALVTQVRHAG